MKTVPLYDSQPLFPPITSVRPRLPDGASYSTMRDAGRCLIALAYDPPKRCPRRIVVRNCYGRASATVVENMREYLPRKKAPKYTGRTGIDLGRLKALGFTLYRDPFMVETPVHNMMHEVTPALFDAAWEAMLSPIDQPHPISPDLTPTMRLINMHWQDRRLTEGWSADRVKRICALWRITPAELATMIQWDPEQMMALADGVPTDIPGPVMVWLYFYENIRTGRSVFPDLSPASSP